MATPAGPETIAGPGPSPEAQPVRSHQTTVRAILAGILLVAGFWPVLVSMYGSWFDPGAYMEHGILVVPAAAYMVWTKWDRLETVRLRPSGWGLGLVVLGGLAAALGVLAHWVWVSRMAFLVSLLGCIALVYGWRMIGQLAYPLCTLLLMIAPPTFVFARLTLSLQLLASRIGEFCLEALGYSVLRDGNVLEMVGIKLSVEEACSGIRSLMAILFMCILYNYFFVRGKWMRALILAVSIPIAVLGNGARIVATGIAGQHNKALVEGAAHEAFGYVSVLFAALGCIAVHLMMVYFQKLWRSRHV